MRIIVELNDGLRHQEKTYRQVCSKLKDEQELLKFLYVVFKFKQLEMTQYYEYDKVTQEVMLRIRLYQPGVRNYDYITISDEVYERGVQSAT